RLLPSPPRRAARGSRRGRGGCPRRGALLLLADSTARSGTRKGGAGREGQEAGTGSGESSNRNKRQGPRSRRSRIEHLSLTSVSHPSGRLRVHVSGRGATLTDWRLE